MKLKSKAQAVISNVRTYWNTPMLGRYMTFKEILAYSGGGIGAYFIIDMGSRLIVSTTNMIVGGAIGVDAWDMYILYIIATLANIPLTAIRASMIDNTRHKSGKYRPYLLMMGIPTAIISLAYVWFPYERLSSIFTNPMFGKGGGYVATCAVVLVFNLLLQFFFNFFNDAYTNLIHVLSPNTQERTDVLAIKSVVYSLAPSILNIVFPLIAQFATNNNLYDIRVYRYGYPVFTLIGIALTCLVFANTKEKIIQAKTHTIQVNFLDAFKAVARNKYFWIISLAGWIGFLEGAYGNILTWSFNYGHTCTGTQYAIITTLTGNASLWGMILAPICIRKWGKKRVLIFVNTMNIVCILAMRANMQSIWWLFLCVYFNWMVGAFEQITTPAIQADIRDYQQYISGERIDGMFATVATIGGIFTMITSSIIPAIQKNYGIFEGNGYAKAFDILDVNTGKPGLLYDMMGILIVLAAAGAFLNMVPYLFYDFNEIKQKSVVRILKVRALFEDYGNNALKDAELVETIDLVEFSRNMATQTERPVSKDIIKEAKENAKSLEKEGSKALIKAAKTQLRENKQYNEDIIISQAVVKELEKFENPVGLREYELCKSIVENGYATVLQVSYEELKKELAQVKALPKNTADEKDLRKFEISLVKDKMQSRSYMLKYFPDGNPVASDGEAFTKNATLYEEKDEALTQAYKDKADAKHNGDKEQVEQQKAIIKSLKAELKQLDEKIKVYMDSESKFNRATKAYFSANKILTQYENYQHFNDIAAEYEAATARKLAAEQAAKEEAARLEAEEKALAEKIKQEKLQKKLEKASDKKQAKILEKEADKKEKKDLKQAKKNEDKDKADEKSKK